MPDNTKMKPVTNEKEKLMYQGTTGLGECHPNAYNLAAAKVPQPETIPQQLESLMKAAYELRQMCGMAADNLAGSIPEGSDCKAPASSTIQDRLREISYTLAEAIACQQRVMRSLAL